MISFLAADTTNSNQQPYYKIAKGLRWLPPANTQ